MSNVVIPPSQAVSISRNASSFDVPWPKNAGEEPIPPKLPQPRMIRVIATPLPPRGRSSIRPILRQRRSGRGRACGSARFETTCRDPEEGSADDVRRCRRPLRPDALQPLRPRAGSSFPRSRSGSGTTSAASRPLETGRAIVRRAFDLGVTHFDLANNYGPPYGSAEENFGLIMRDDLRPYRDELVDLDEGRATTCGPARTATAARGSTSSRASTRASSGSVSTTSTSSTPIASTPRPRSRRRWARSTAPSGRARRSTSASRRTRRRRPARRTRSSAISARRS